MFDDKPCSYQPLLPALEVNKMPHPRKWGAFVASINCRSYVDTMHLTTSLASLALGHFTSLLRAFHLLLRRASMHLKTRHVEPATMYASLACPSLVGGR